MVQPPHPDWQPGQSMMHPFPSSETIDLDPAELGARGMYPFVISSIVPRPIAFICSVSKKASATEQPALLANDIAMSCAGPSSSVGFQANLISSMHFVGKNTLSTYSRCPQPLSKACLRSAGPSAAVL